MTTLTEQRIQSIEEKLNTALAPSTLMIIDESAPHQGHAGAATGLGYFAVTIASKEFMGKGLVECHRLVYQALGAMMQTDIHALRIIIKN
jgi:BolA protein